MPAKSIATILEALAAPTPKDEVKTRPGKGGSGDLSYIDARFAMERLDESVGPQNWQDQYRDVDGGVEAGVGIKLDGEWVWKYDVGIRSKIEPVKGGYSDAFKRACVKWGIARDLYDPTSEVYQDAAPAEKAEKQVVGQSGLSSKQKALLAIAFKEAGIPDNQRRAVIWLLVQKNSSKQLNNEELDIILDVLRNKEQHAEHWENIEMLEGVGE